jgi:hypothetical protein
VLGEGYENQLTEFAKRVNATVTNAEKREIYAIEEQMYQRNKSR